jgi:preprotein translocase subunit Sec63
LTTLLCKRVSVHPDSSLRLLTRDADQTAVLLQTPTLLSALLSITLARNWLQPTLAAMRLHAYITQALLPRVAVKKGMEVGQLPKMAGDESAQVVAGGDVKDMSAFASKLAERGDERVADVNKALRQWPRLDLVDVSFKGTLSRRIHALLADLRDVQSSMSASSRPCPSSISS